MPRVPPTAQLSPQLKLAAAVHLRFMIIRLAVRHLPRREEVFARVSSQPSDALLSSVSSDHARCAARAF